MNTKFVLILIDMLNDINLIKTLLEYYFSSFEKILAIDVTETIGSFKLLLDFNEYLKKLENDANNRKFATSKFKEIQQCLFTLMTLTNINMKTNFDIKTNFAKQIKTAIESRGVTCPTDDRLFKNILFNVLGIDVQNYRNEKHNKFDNLKVFVNINSKNELVASTSFGFTFKGEICRSEFVNFVQCEFKKEKAEN